MLEEKLTPAEKKSRGLISAVRNSLAAPLLAGILASTNCSAKPVYIPEATAGSQAKRGFIYSAPGNYLFEREGVFLEGSGLPSEGEERYSISNREVVVKWESLKWDSLPLSRQARVTHKALSVDYKKVSWVSGELDGNERVAFCFSGQKAHPDALVSAGLVQIDVGDIRYSIWVSPFKGSLKELNEFVKIKFTKP